jgi:transcriptional regulator with XRE-family HTH domain
MKTVVRSTKDWEVELGERIHATRKQQEMTQQDLADRANVSRSAIKYLEAGRGSTLATFVKVIRALGLDGSFDQTFAATSRISPLAIIQAKKKSGRK